MPVLSKKSATASRVEEGIRFNEIEDEVRAIEGKVEEERDKVRQRRQTSKAKLEELKQVLFEQTQKEAPENGR